jgi:hypothetical protein
MPWSQPLCTFVSSIVFSPFSHPFLAYFSLCFHPTTPPTTTHPPPGVSVYLLWTLANSTGHVRNDLISPNIDPKKLLVKAGTLGRGQYQVSGADSGRGLSGADSGRGVSGADSGRGLSG